MVFDEKFIDKNIGELCELYDSVHGSNVNIARMAPDYVDGLKLVARRLLYIMYLKDRGKNFRKVASISGDTIARIHHHNQNSVVECLVNLSQEWSNNIPLIEGMGNFGSCSGDKHAADRYIQARLSDYAYDCFFSDWKESAVDMVLGADEETFEPMYLPAKYPNILVNGALGIGYGMATSICPFNFKEVIEATIKLINDPDVDILLIPDSPTGCDVIEGNFRKITDSGSGIYSMRCTYEISDENNLIKITTLPYQVTVNSIREKIADIKEKNGLPELIGMQDHSGQIVDLRLFIKDNINPYKFMKKLIEQVSGLEYHILSI
jgi:DNA gyrase subunit A